MEPEIISRREAIARGLAKFYTGEPCKHGHTTERYTCNGGCIGCLKVFIPKRNGQTAVAKGIQHWPPNAFTFLENGNLVSRDDAEMTFRYMMAEEWHMHALTQLRANPALAAKYGRPVMTAAGIKHGHKALREAMRNLSSEEIVHVLAQKTGATKT
jgi:hypothetical protein